MYCSGFMQSFMLPLTTKYKQTKRQLSVLDKAEDGLTHQSL